MASMSNYVCSGNLTKDPELKAVGNSKVLNFAVAVTTGFGEKVDTHYVDCSLWGKRGETIAQYLDKGSSVVVSGELKARSYEGKNGKGMSLDLQVSDLSFNSPKKDRPSNRNGQQSYGNAADDIGDSIPFPD